MNGAKSVKKEEESEESEERRQICERTQNRCLSSLMVL